MRLRIARKVILASRWGWADGRWVNRQIRGRTLRRAWLRIHRVHRRHFPGPVLRPISHRKGERP